MIAVSSPKMQAESAASLHLPDLLDRPLILYRRYEKLILDAFHAQDLEPDVFCICDDARGAMLWAEAGLATAVFPRSMQSLCGGLRVQTLAEPALETQIVLIWKKGGRLSPVAQDFPGHLPRPPERFVRRYTYI